MSKIYKRPIAAATMCYVVQEGNLPSHSSVLLVKRNSTSKVYPNYWCFPGGFLEVEKETLEECASREMLEETNIAVDCKKWNLLDVQSGPNDDPRGHMINVAYYIWTNKFPQNVIASDDVCEYKWVSVHKLSEYNLAFKHNDLALKLLK